MRKIVNNRYFTDIDPLKRTVYRGFKNCKVLKYKS